MYRKLHVESTDVKTEGRVTTGVNKTSLWALITILKTETLKGNIPRTKPKNPIKQNQNHRNTNKTTREMQRLKQGNKGGINQNEGAEAWRPIKGFRMT